MRYCLFLMLLCAGLAGMGLHGQTEPGSSVFRSDTSLVLVPALVKTQRGEVVYALAGSDFSMTDDGVEQHPTLEQDTDRQPLALVIVVQTGGAALHHLEEYRALTPMLEALGGNVPYQAAVVSFDSHAAIAQPFTGDMALAGGALAELAPGDRCRYFRRLEACCSLAAKAAANVPPHHIAAE